MARSVARAVALLVVAALACLAMVACGAGKAATTAADYTGLWVNPEFNNEIWLHVTADGHKVTLRWEREWDEPVVQRATLRDDGTLDAPAVSPAPGQMGGGGPAYTGLLTPGGGLDMSTTTHVTGVNAAIPVTLHFRRGSQAHYAPFARRMNANLRAQAISDDYGAALETIGSAITRWAADHGGQAPPAKAVRPDGGVGRQMQAAGTSWPRLSDGRLLLPGRGRGEYVYHPLAHGYRIGGLEPDGQGPQTTSGTW